MRSVRALFTALLACGLLAGCVYYNTFYNARKRYQEAEDRRIEAETAPETQRPSLLRSATDYYLTAIRKASTVLQLHPESKWVDDSLLLIGKAYYWRQEYTEAMEKFRELEQNFPESELLPETGYWQALTLWELGERGRARDLLRKVGSGPSRFAWHARLSLAELDAGLGNIEAAIEGYTGLLDALEDASLKPRIYRGLGDAYFGLDRMDEALGAYASVLQHGPSVADEFETLTRIGEIQELRGEFDGARQTYERIEKSGRLKPYEAQVQIKQANLLRLRGSLDAAQEAYDAIIEEYPRSEFSAEALYRRGLIEYEDRRDLDAAMDLLSRARRERTGSEAGDRARVLENTLYQLKRERGRAEKGDDRALDANLAMAELYLFNLGETDSAVAAYERAYTLADSAGSELAPRALYAIARITADSLGNPGRARELFGKLIESFPVTEYAIDARKRVEGQRSDDLLAEARFLEAETLLREGAALQDVQTIYEEVSREYPRSVYAPRALFALAWTYENDADEYAKAVQAYEQVVERFPLTSFAERAQERLEAGFLKEAIERASNPQPPASAEPGVADSTAVDTVRTDRAPEPATPAAPAPPVPSPKAGAGRPLEFDEVDQPPQVLDAPQPEPREELLEEDIDPIVQVRVLVGRDGLVKRAEVVSGSDLLRDAAVETASLYKFNPAVHNGTAVEVAMTLPIRFSPPDGEGKP